MTVDNFMIRPRSIGKVHTRSIIKLERNILHFSQIGNYVSEDWDAQNGNDLYALLPIGIFI